MTKAEQYINKLKSVSRKLNELYKYHEIMSNELEKEIIILQTKIGFERDNIRDEER